MVARSKKIAAHATPDSAPRHSRPLQLSIRRGPRTRETAVSSGRKALLQGYGVLIDQEASLGIARPPPVRRAGSDRSLMQRGTHNLGLALLPMIGQAVHKPPTRAIGNEFCLVTAEGSTTVLIRDDQG